MGAGSRDTSPKLGRVPIQPGTRLGAYEVKQLIGQGAMGSVYSARHEALDRTAAVKVMHALGDDAVAGTRFRREGQAIAHLRHPNILTVFDYGEHEGTPYMIVEFIEGGSLAARLKAKGRMEPAKAIELLRGMAAGLDHAHQMGVVHRDVKPANVLMGPNDSPVIADFGLAKLQQQATMTASGVATGTPAYMAPEQITEGGEIGSAADIYAFATVAYELLTGRLPYESDGVMQLLMAKLRDEPTPPTQRDPTLPRKIDSILLRGLARQPDARWPTCTALVDALAGVLEPKPELFAATQPVQRPRVARSWRTWSWAALPALAVIGALIAFVVVPRLQHKTPAPPVPASPVSSVVACPDISPAPQISASPNPAVAGSTITLTATGFDGSVPMFVVIDGIGDCTNPTSGTVVYTAVSHTDPVTTNPITLPATIPPGSYQLRACSHNPGSNPSSCVQVPFSVTPEPPTPTPSPVPSPSPTPLESPSALPTS
jgi:serine/threonine protein kinase